MEHPSYALLMLNVDMLNRNCVPVFVLYFYKYILYTFVIPLVNKHMYMLTVQKC